MSSHCGSGQPQAHSVGAAAADNFFSAELGMASAPHSRLLLVLLFGEAAPMQLVSRSRMLNFLTQFLRNFILLSRSGCVGCTAVASLVDSISGVVCSGLDSVVGRTHSVTLVTDESSHSLLPFELLDYEYSHVFGGTEHTRILRLTQEFKQRSFTSTVSAQFQWQEGIVMQGYATRHFNIMVSLQEECSPSSVGEWILAVQGK